MPAKTGHNWSWAQSRQANNAVVAVMLIKPNHSIAVTLPRPKGWTGKRKQDEDLVRALLFSAAEEGWVASPGAP